MIYTITHSHIVIYLIKYVSCHYLCNKNENKSIIIIIIFAVASINGSLMSNINFEIQKYLPAAI